MATRVAMVLAVVLGIVAALGMRAWIQRERQEVEKDFDPVEITVAARNLKKGDIIAPRVLTAKLIPRNLVVGGMIPKSEQELYAGRILMENVMTGEPVFRQLLETRSEKRLTLESEVRPGRRAVTLRVDQVTGVAGLIRPGDYIDILATYNVHPSPAAQPAAAQPARGQRPGSAPILEQEMRTIYLLQAVRVIAVDSRTMDIATRSRASQYRTITVEVDPWDAMRLVNAQNQAMLQMLLRSPADVEIAKNRHDDAEIHWETSAEAVRTVNYIDVPRPEPGEDESP